MIREHEELGTHFPQSVGQSFSTMETKMNEVGRTAVRIGALLVSLPDVCLLLTLSKANSLSPFTNTANGHRPLMTLLITTTSSHGTRFRDSTP